MKWFKHMSNASSDLFIQDLESEFGDTGYVFWFKTLELLGSQGTGGTMDISETVWRQVIHSRRTDHLRRLYAFATKREKLSVETLPSGLLRVTCPKFAEFADNYTRFDGVSTKRLQRVSKLSDSRTEEEVDKKEKKSTHIVPVGDFDFVWKQYPNRSGRKNALRHFQSTVNNDKDYGNLQRALANYLQSGNVKRGFIKNGSTWFNEWQDWIEPSETMMKGNSDGTTGQGSGQGWKSDQMRRATFSHGKQEIDRLKELEATLIERDRKRGERSGLD